VIFPVPRDHAPALPLSWVPALSLLAAWAPGTRTPQALGFRGPEAVNPDRKKGKFSLLIEPEVFLYNSNENHDRT
jgi:hypothetical protein